MADGAQFTGMLVPYSEGRIHAITAPARALLIPTFRDREALEFVMNRYGIVYDEVRTIEDGEAFLRCALEDTGHIGVSIHPAHKGRVITLKIETPVA